MSRVSKYKGKTASQIANERYQFRKDKQFREDIKPLNKKKKKEKKEYFMKDPMKNEIASLTPPEKGPTPQGLKNGDAVNIGKGLKFRVSGDVSYEKKVKTRDRRKNYL